MKIKILDENAKWWKGEPVTWAYEDKRGDWWLIKDDPKQKPNMKIKPTKESSRSMTIKEYFFIFLCACLGTLTAMLLTKYLLLN